MGNHQRYRQAVEKHSENEYLRTALKKSEFISGTSCFVRQSIDHLALLVVTGEIEDASDILKTLDRLEKMATDLAPKQASNTESNPWHESKP